MINLQQLIEKFVDKAVSQIDKKPLGPEKITLKELDKRATNALSNKADLDRSKCIEEWLNVYRVFQGIEAEARTEIANAVVGFADKIERAPESFSDPFILKEFNRLREDVEPIKLNAHGKKRKMTSLCSKALWACYPFYVPIYDGYACRALWVISRLLDIRTKAEEGKNPYPQYFRVWCDLYERCLPFILDEKLRGYTYKVRVFDQVLWLIGQPKFETL